MVMLFARRVFGGADVPAIEAEFPDGISTGGGDAQLALFQGIRHPPDAVQHLILRRNRTIGLMAADAGDKTCCGRVHDDGMYGQSADQCFQLGIVFLVRFLPSLSAGIIIILPQAVPGALSFPPQATGEWVYRAIVAGEIVAAAVLRWFATRWLPNIG